MQVHHDNLRRVIEYPKRTNRPDRFALVLSCGHELLHYCDEDEAGLIACGVCLSRGRTFHCGVCESAMPGHLHPDACH